ncbi:MAG: RNA polymerase sigma factor [Isosphaeraceae bacterium]
MTGPPPNHGAEFPSTRWTLIARARGLGASEVDEALSWLCREYWFPVYAYIRRRGHDPDQAQDATQEFFTRLLEKRFLGSVDPSKGKFRAFLLSCCKHFLANERDRRQATKRGGGRASVSIDSHDAERRYFLEPVESQTPESLFDRRWALTLLDNVIAQLGREYHAKGKGELFELLKASLAGELEAPTYTRIGEALGLREDAVKKAAQRLRARYREVLRERIADTVSSPTEVDEELRFLRDALRS